jgi:hypothetical protein
MPKEKVGWKKDRQRWLAMNEVLAGISAEEEDDPPEQNEQTQSSERSNSFSARSSPPMTEEVCTLH